MRHNAIRAELVKIGRRIAKEKLVLKTGGNTSARIGHFMYIKAKGATLGSSVTKDYICVNLKTGLHKGGTPSAETYMHSACYRARRDIKAILHVHPVFSTAVANSRVRLGVISYELIACLGSELLRSRYKPAGSKQLACVIASIIRKTNAVLMPNHGLLTVGDDLNEAFERTIAVERACKTLIFSRLLGLSRFLPKKEADKIIRMYSA